MSSFNIDTGTTDNIYQPSATDPSSGPHGIAETAGTTIVDLEATQAGVIDLANRVGATAWAATTAVKRLKLGLGTNGTLVQCLTAGTTGSSQPSWPTTPGSTVTDGSVTWTVLSPGTGAYVAVKEAPLNPLNYGAAGDGVTVDDAAFAAMSAVMPSTGGAIQIPDRYNFLLSNTWALPSTVTKFKISGAGPGSIITNNTNDLFNPAGTAMDRSTISDLQLVCGSSGGHIFNFTAAEISQSTFRDLVLIQNNPAKSLLTLQSGVTGGVVDSTFERWYVTYAANRSVSGIDIENSSLNDNVFRGMRFTDQGSPSTWMILLKATSGVAVSNLIERINFENPVGGAIRLLAHYKPILRQIWLWDLAATTTNHLISIGQVSSQATQQPDISQLYRNTGTLGSSLYDLYFEGAGQVVGAWIHDISNSSGGTAVALNPNGAPDTVIERVYGGVTLGTYAGTVAVGAGAGTGATATAPADAWQGNIGVTIGTSPAAGAQVTYSFRNASHVAPTGVVITPLNSATAAAGIYVSSVGTSGFTVSSQNTPGGNLSFAFRVLRAAGSNGP